MSLFIALVMTLQLLLHIAASLPFTTVHSQTLISRNDLPISTNGLCGSAVNVTCLNSVFGDSCSVWDFCGSYYKADFAGTGCQADFGVCNPDLTSTTSSPVRLVAATTSSAGIVIVPVTTIATITTTYGFQSPLTMTTTTTTSSQAPMQTAFPKFGFCGVSGSNCAR